jgi:predicted phage tail protein
MRITIMAGVAASCLALAACGGKGDDKLGEQAQESMENKADAMDAAADNMSGPAADMMEANADATREAGDAKEEAIDDSDVNADAMSNAQKDAVVNGQ